MQLTFIDYEKYSKNKQTPFESGFEDYLKKQIEAFDIKDINASKIDTIKSIVMKSLNVEYQHQYPNRSRVHLVEEKIDLNFQEKIGYEQDTFSKLSDDIDNKIYYYAINQRTSYESIELIHKWVMDYIVDCASLESKYLEKVDPDLEKNALIEHIQKHWDGFDKHNVNDVITKVWTQAIYETRQNIEGEGILDIVQQWNNERNDFNHWSNAGTKLTNSNFVELKPLDAVNKSIAWLIMGPMNIQSAFSEQWDYEKVCNNIISQLKTEFPGIAKVKPKGWLKLVKNYKSFGGIDDYLEKQKEIDKQEFKGIDSGTAASHNFQTRVALPYVMHGDKDQGVTALETLVGAIVAHAYAVSGHNNNADLTKDITALKDKYSTVECYQNLLLSMDLKNTLTSPVGRALTVIMEDKITWTLESELKTAKKDLKNEPVIKEKPLKLGSKESKEKIAAMNKRLDETTPVKTKEDKLKEKEDKKLLEEKILAAFDTVVVSKKLKM